MIPVIFAPPGYSNKQEGNGPIDQRAAGAMIWPPRLLSGLGGLFLTSIYLKLLSKCTWELGSQNARI